MKKALFVSVFVVLSLVSLVARAEVVVLVHGYLGDAGSWERSGISNILQQHRWARAGVFTAGPSGVQLIPAAGQQSERKFYSVDLPS